MVSVQGLPCSHASSAQPLHRRFEAMRSFFLERRPAVRPAPRLRQRIVALRKRNLSVPDIRAWLDAEEPRSPSERVIEKVLKDEGFQRLPRRTRAERFASAPPTVGAPASVLLAPDRAESFQCESAAGVLCLLPWVRRYGVDRAIAEAGFPGSSALPALPSVLAFLALKLASARRYSCDDLWRMDRGPGLFAGLNVLPETAWFSSYSDRVIRPMNQRLLAALARIWSERRLASDAANLDFTPIPHWGDDATLQKHWSGHRGRSLVGLSVALAQNPDSGLILRTNASTDRETTHGAVLEFLDFFRRHGPAVRCLAFDSRFTTYAHLARLDRDGVLFVTVRRRGKRLVERARALDAASGKQVRVPLQQGTRLVEAHDARVTLRGYDGELRQITVLRDRSRRPALLLTNDFDSSLSHILRRYARRWLVEQSISEQLAFFHLNRLSSSMVIKADFDLAMTVTAYNLYRLLALDLPPGHRHLTARTLFEKMLCTGAAVSLDKDTCTVALQKQRNLPALQEALHAQEPVRIPWLGDRRIVFQGATRS